MTSRVERRPLTRDAIVAAAIKVIERDGPRALTMRKVAAELGVGVMSLYNHVPDRDALIADVGTAVMADLDFPEGVPGLPGAAAGPAGDWKDGARALVGAFRRLAGRYPRSVHLVMTTRLDLSIRWDTTEKALAGLGAAGFDGETSVRIIRTLMAFAIGSQMMEHGAVRTAGKHAVLQEPDAYPRSIELAAELAHYDPAGDFELGLTMLLDAMDRLPRAQ